MVDIPTSFRALRKVRTESGQRVSTWPNQSEGVGAASILGARSSGSESGSGVGSGGGSGAASGGGRGTDEATGIEGLPLDLAFEILKNGRRRQVLAELSRASGDLTTGELSERIAAWENDKPVAEISSEERKRVYVGLYQCHLPKMDDANVVVFNKDRGIVAPGEHADLLDRYLTPATQERSTASEGRSRLYRWTATTALVAVLLAVSLAIETVSGVPTATLGLTVLLAVTGTICLDEARTEEV